MKPELCQESFHLILVILVLSMIQGCIRQADASSYETCSQPISCGNLGNVKYPFYGNDRPESCGYPGFKLDCQADVSLITINSIPYRVLEIFENSYVVRVAREDLLKNTCPDNPTNTVLDYNLFSFSTISGDQNITLNYGCEVTVSQPPTIPVNRSIICENPWSGMNMFWITGEASFLGSFVSCSKSISVPVNRTWVGVLASPVLTVSLQEALGGGFSIQWSANNVNCEACKNSGGICGTDQDPSSFTCYCSNGSFSLSCNSGARKDSGDSSSNVGKKIGPALGGAALAGILVGWFVFHYRQKRKNRITAKSVQDSSKEISTNPSSKGLSTLSSASFTRSIPSFPTSKSELVGGSTYFGAYLFSYAELEEATDNFDPSRELGDGGFGTVYYGKLPDGRSVAVKRLYENNVKRVDQFMNEVEILTKLRHQNLVKLYGCTSKRSRDLLLVYEYIPNGTVADHLHGKRAKSGLLSWPIRLKIAIETADALAYLHKSDTIHRDVKTNNVLLDNDFSVKVADFGLSRLFPADVTHVSTAPQGTPGYVDPEYYQCYQLTEKSDVYSFGVMLIELISSLQAVDTNRHRQDINLANMAINKIQNRSLSELVDKNLGFETNSKVRRMVTQVAELAFRCLLQERDMRPSMADLLGALRRIQDEDLNVDRIEIDILGEDETLHLKGGMDQPVSPDSVFLNKWNSSSTPDSSA